MNVIFNIHDIIHYTQTLESDVECRERLRLWSYAGLFNTRQGRYGQSIPIITMISPPLIGISDNQA